MIRMGMRFYSGFACKKYSGSMLLNGDAINRVFDTVIHVYWGA